MQMGTPGVYPTKSKNRELTLARIRVNTSTGAAPDGVVDEGGVLDPTTPTAYAATGLLKFNLRDRWRLVDVVGCYQVNTTAGATVRPYAKVEGTAADNYVQLIEETAHSATSTDDKETVLILALWR